MRLMGFLGSLRLGVVLLGVYAAVLAWATLIESWHGSEAARSAVYGAGWFVWMNAILAANVFCAVVVRLCGPGRKAAFAAAHVGVLVLMVGCWASRQFGVEAQLAVFEGKTSGAARQESADLGQEDVRLGFQIHLHKFRRKLDPGGGMASHYSSLVDFVDRSDPPRTLAENVLITLNAPVDFRDPESGRTYRLFQSSFSGPWRPGGPEFDKIVEGKRDRDQVYLSRLSVNYDPGRGLKYFGCAMIVGGMVLGYFWRPRAVAAIFLAFFALTPNVGFAAGDDLDWDRWGRLPVLGDGRVEPLETFARETVEAICGRACPTVEMPGEGDKKRKVQATELLFNWLVEPEKWEKIAFLRADDRELRADVLGAPLADENGRGLRYVSPAEVEGSEEFARRWTALQHRANAEGKTILPTGVDRRIAELMEAYDRFRLLTFNGGLVKETPRRFGTRLYAAANAWRKLAGSLAAAEKISKDEAVRRPMVEAGGALHKLVAMFQRNEFSRKKVEPLVAEFHRASGRISDKLAGGDDKALAGMGAEMHRQTGELFMALYDNGESLRLTPSLSIAALEENRTPEDDARPWLGFGAFWGGSDELMREYPQAELAAARKAFGAVKAAYLDRSAKDRPRKFAAAMKDFATAVGELGRAVEPARQGLFLLHRDQELIDATAYPAEGSTAAEIFYCRLNPFFWSWVVSAAATFFLLVSAVWKQNRWFRLGAGTLIVGQAFTAVGMGLRWYITGLIPLTGMFETVVFVSLYAALLGLWFAVKRGVASGKWQVASAENQKSEIPDSTQNRHVFALAGAIVAVGAMVLAYYAPASVMKRNIGSVAPILRDNFWLAVHVVTIMTSYASAVIALILGNVSLGWFLFTRGERVASGQWLVASADNHKSEIINQKSLAPNFCSILAGYIYTMFRITALLLAAGTILGALWADKAWGRFWAWDPKEVWALISLLVYLMILHARRANWVGDFGMAAAAVLGATAILFTWYGVNFLLGSGMHSYGSGAGGAWQVAAAVGVQWAFVAAAGIRKTITQR